MTLDEAIKHCNEVACKHDKCATEHKQLAEWLTELKSYRASITQETQKTADKNEKIRKELMDFIYVTCFPVKDLKKKERFLDWLEKQKVTDEEIIFRPIVGTDIRIAAKQALEKIDIGKKVVLAFNGAYIPVNGKTVGEIDSEYDAWLEKQGKQEPYGQRKECEDCQFNYAGECKGFCQMKRDEQNPVDEVEPKFKVGDIVQYITDSTDRRKIEEIDTLCNMYHTDSSPIMFEIEDEWKVVVNAEDVEQESVDKVDFEKKELKKIESKKLDPDKVIAWLVGNICDFEYYVKRFKQDFGL